MKKFYRESETTTEEVLELLEAAKEKGLIVAPIALDYFDKGDLTTVWQALRGCTDWFERELDIEIELEGVAIVWHSDSTLGGSCNHKDGERDGEDLEWDEDGDSTTHELYDMGKLVKDYLKGNDHE